MTEFKKYKKATYILVICLLIGVVMFLLNERIIANDSAYFECEDKKEEKKEEEVIVKKNSCKEFIEKQLPNSSICFDGETRYSPLISWNDNTPIKSIKNEGSLSGSGYGSSGTFGGFEFYKGNKIGEIKDKIYTRSYIYRMENGVVKIQKRFDNYFYLEYEKENIHESGLIMEPLHFRISLTYMDISEENGDYCINDFDYTIEECNI